MKRITAERAPARIERDLIHPSSFGPSSLSCHGWDSNPHCPDSESGASFRLGYRGVFRAGARSLGRR